MDRLEYVIIGMSVLVICVGLGMIITGIPKHSEHDIVIGGLVIFLGSTLIFLRLAFREKEDKPSKTWRSYN